jgi:hypothetical protein
MGILLFMGDSAYGKCFLAGKEEHKNHRKSKELVSRAYPLE